MTTSERAAAEINLTPPITEAELRFGERMVLAASVSPVWESDEDDDGALEAAREIRYQACAAVALLREAIAEERETCAKYVEDLSGCICAKQYNTPPGCCPHEIAAAIRARTQAAHHGCS